MRRLVLVSTSMVVALCVLPAPAGADVFGPISLVSEGPFGGETQQAEYAHDPAISGNGRYVAFDGSIGGVTGVWRRDLQTGALEQVAGGDAELPSISAGGQYVSFTTNEGLSLPEVSQGKPDASPHQEPVNVYVRDMAVQPAATKAEEAARPAGERAFTVVSAVDGSEEPLTYSGASTTRGSTATGRSAIERRRRRGGVRDDRRVKSRSLPQGRRRRTERGNAQAIHADAAGRGALCAAAEDGARQSLLRALRRRRGTGGGEG